MRKLIDAVIQNDAHQFIIGYWSSNKAKRFIIDDQEGLQPSFREIVFDEIYP